MYKSTSESGNYLKRVASHSTKGSRSGVVTVLPPEAKPDLDMYTGLAKRHAALVQQYENLRERSAALKAKRGVINRMGRSATREELREIDQERDDIGNLLEPLTRELSALRSLKNATYTKAYEKCFVAVAQLVLSTDAFTSVHAMVIDLTGPQPTGLLNDQLRRERINAVGGA